MTTQTERTLQLAMDYASAQRAGNLHKSREALDALKAAVEAMAVPEGWRMVPVASTAGMDAAGGLAWMKADRVNPDAVYRAMIQAAPEVPK